ncbi:hypothetical protein Taro_029392 [Colocasia esculenta]|uniref:BHLH domain-containing protein n=1 Tax=Colocasia esculenta TaxID=4460 RepID=A0A843VL88_COLES|nr:hypothetical protein [Colocasia esculenta]
MEEVEGDYSADRSGSEFSPLEYSLDHHHSHHLLRPRESPGDNMEMVDYVLNQPPPHRHQQPQPHLSLDKLNFADVMQFADFGPKLALSQSRPSDDESYFLKFPVLGGGRLHDDDLVHVMDPQQSSLPFPLAPPLLLDPNMPGAAASNHGEGGINMTAGAGAGAAEKAGVRHLHEELLDDTPRGGTSENISSSVQQPQLHSASIFDDRKRSSDPAESKNRRKRPRSMKTSEEVEIQRMTHIAVERNRRKQMNEHLRVLRSLMPGSYVQRGDQASIIGGAIEFVRELEQLLQCLESQKRRRMFGGEALRALPAADPQPPIQQSHQLPPFFSPPPPPPPPALFPGGGDQMAKLLDYDTAARASVADALGEEAAESKSCLADVEVKLLGFDAMIKILSRRRPGQLLKTIAALEDMPLHILHTNITTIEQTVLYSFNVKITGEPRFSAEDIANSVQQIFSFINASAM